MRTWSFDKKLKTKYVQTSTLENCIQPAERMRRGEVLKPKMMYYGSEDVLHSTLLKGEMKDAEQSN